MATPHLYAYHTDAEQQGESFSVVATPHLYAYHTIPPYYVLNHSTLTPKFRIGKSIKLTVSRGVFA